MKGLHVNIFRWDLGDCTGGGVTGGEPGARRRQIAVFPVPGGNADLAVELARGEPVLYLSRGPLGHWRATPEPLADGQQNGERWWMAGGNYIGTSDSRWRDHIGRGPDAGDLVAVHDRTEA